LASAINDRAIKLSLAKVEYHATANRCILKISDWKIRHFPLVSWRMLTQNLVLLLLITLAGCVVTFVGARNKGNYRRSIIASGIVLVHVGILGILYDKLALTPFLSLLLFVSSLFVRIDPFKVGRFFPEKSFQTTSLLLFLASIAFFAMFLTGFPVWLWALPLLLYLMPYLTPSWRAKQFYFRLFSWLLIFGFLSAILGNIYTVYSPDSSVARFNPVFSRLGNKQQIENRLNFLPKPHPNPLQPTLEQNRVDNNESKNQVGDLGLIHNPVKSPQSQTLSPTIIKSSEEEPSQILEDGPLLESLRSFDQKYLELKRDYQELQDKYRHVLFELNQLKNQNEPNTAP